MFIWSLRYTAVAAILGATGLRNRSAGLLNGDRPDGSLGMGRKLECQEQRDCRRHGQPDQPGVEAPRLVGELTPREREEKRSDLRERIDCSAAERKDSSLEQVGPGADLRKGDRAPGQTV